MTVETKSVVITGAGTGIGLATTTYLHQKGFLVFPTVMNESERQSLAAVMPQSCHPIVCDITQADRLNCAVAEVRNKLGDRGLDGLVNNAGIISTGPLEYLNLESYQKQLEVNVIAQLAVTQAFLPLLKKAKGRLINMSSASGICVIPLVGPYCSSKFAMEALTDGLRMELKRWGIHVCAIEPGSVRTPIMKAADEAIYQNSNQKREVLKKEYGDLIEGISAGFQGSGTKGDPPEKVARIIEHALTAERPKTRYLVGKVAYLRKAVSFLPDRLRDAVLTWALRVKLIS